MTGVRGARHGHGSNDLPPTLPLETVAGDTSCVNKPLLLLSPAQAAHALSVHRSTVYELMNAGAIASFSIGRARRISIRALEAYIAAQEREQGARDASA
jgi:excisionase family DNA binding protein